MTQGKHTPGPWVRDCWDILGKAKRHGGGTGHVCEVSCSNGADEKYWEDGEADANARLIAAAPDLLKALADAHRCLSVAVKHAGGDPDAHHVCNAASAAIARATGEKP